MNQPLGLVNALPVIPIFVAHLAGVVAIIVLMVRRGERSISALLALVGFGVMSALDAAHVARGPLIRFMSLRLRGRLRPAVAGTGCCCSMFEVVAIVCLIIAVWQTVAVTSVVEDG